MRGALMDPFHVVALAGAKLDLIRQPIQHQTLGRRGHTGDPLYGLRRIARTRIQLLSVRQYHRLTSVLDADEQRARHGLVEAISSTTKATRPLLDTFRNFWLLTMSIPATSKHPVWGSKVKQNGLTLQAAAGTNGGNSAQLLKLANARSLRR
jgi:hypothetical protein